MRGLEFVLPALKSFNIEYYCLHPPPTPPAIVYEIVRVAPNLRRLQVGRVPVRARDPDPPILQTLADLGITQAGRLSNLVELSVQLHLERPHAVFANLRFPCLLALKLGFVNLSLMADLNQFLRDACPSLESLEVRALDMYQEPEAGDIRSAADDVDELPRLRHFGFHLRPAPATRKTDFFSLACADASAILDRKSVV